MTSSSTAPNRNVLQNSSPESEGMRTTTKSCDDIFRKFIENKTLQKNLDDIYFDNSYHGLDENHKSDDIYRFKGESFDEHNSLHMNLLLLRAGLSGDVDVFNKCIEAKANIFFTDCGGRTILHHSVYSKSYSIVQTLLEYILKQETSVMSDYINWRDRRGWTPLHIAVCRDDARIAEYLLRFGANLLLPLSHNSSPCRDTPAHSQVIHFCAIRSNEDMLHVLLKYGADAQTKDSLGLLPLHYAAAKGNENFTKKLLLTAPDTLNVQDEFLRTPLHIAAMRGSESIVSLFIEMGADLLKKDAMDIDCFYQAVISSHPNTALLIKEAIMKKYPDRNLLETTLPEHQFELNDVETKVCNMLLSSLKENQVDLIARCVSRLGIHMCMNTLQQSLVIQKNGGMRISGNGRKKTAGGVFIALLKEKVQAGTITLEDWSYIRAVYREKQRSCRSRRRRSNYIT